MGLFVWCGPFMEKRMRMLMTLVALTCCGGALVGMVSPETKVEVKNVHICCGACVKAVGKVLDDAGVKGTCDKKAKTITFTAVDEKAAQKALDGLAAGGFH